MEPIVFDSIPFELSTADLASELRIEPESEDYEAFEALLREVAAVARPKALYTTSFITGRGEEFVELDGVRMCSRIMVTNFSKIHRVFPYVATCGTEVETWSAGLADFLHIWWMDVVKARVLFKAVDHLNAHLKDALKLGSFSSMNPGSLPDWPITAQPGLFSLLGDVKAKIGVSLTDSMLMLPAKSVSGVNFQTESGFENCALCSRKNCTGRRKPYDEQKYTELIGNCR